MGGRQASQRMAKAAWGEGMRTERMVFNAPALAYAEKLERRLAEAESRITSQQEIIEAQKSWREPYEKVEQHYEAKLTIAKEALKQINEYANKFDHDGYFHLATNYALAQIAAGGE